MVQISMAGMCLDGKHAYFSLYERDAEYGFALHIAIAAQQLQIVKTLITFGADVIFYIFILIFRP